MPTRGLWVVVAIAAGGCGSVDAVRDASIPDSSVDGTRCSVRSDCPTGDNCIASSCVPAGSSCSSLLQAVGGTDGDYWIDPDGAGGALHSSHTAT
jgi:hypothetical protein